MILIIHYLYLFILYKNRSTFYLFHYFIESLNLNPNKFVSLFVNTVLIITNLVFKNQYLVFIN
jgi:hypothetical protein